MAEKRVGFSKTKVWFVFVALFVCGLMAGGGIANWKRVNSVKQVANTDVATEQNVAQDLEPLTKCQAIERFLLRWVHNNDNDCYKVRDDLDTYQKLAMHGCDENRVEYQQQIENKNAILFVACGNEIESGEKPLTECQAVERVLLGGVHNDDNNCDFVRDDLDTYKKLAMHGCGENRAEYQQQIENKNAILFVACGNEIESGAKPCVMIERNLQERLGREHADMDAEYRIGRARIYAIMAERGCPENASGYVEAAKRELEIARGISDDKFDQDETIDVVETYKRLQMQNAAEEIFEKAKKLTNPAIDFIMQVEKIINE